MKQLRPGKIGHRLLRELLSKYTRRGEGVVVGPKVGEDAAVLEIGEKYVVVTTDPITYTTDRIGWYSVQINANDVASMGAVPEHFLAVLLLPEKGTTERMVERVFSDIDRACRELGVTLIGGHTEITPQLEKLIVCGVMIGQVEKEKLVTSAGAEPGDTILLTKGIAIEGTSIIAREKEAELREKYGKEFVERAKFFLDRPGMSVVKEALVANRAAHLSSLHDPTEGGLATGLREVALASGVGIEVDYNKIPIYPETRTLCEECGLAPLGLIASGALIITCSSKEAPKVEDAFSKEDIPYSVIGRVKEKGLTLIEEGKRIDLPAFETDELTKIL